MACLYSSCLNSFEHLPLQASPLSLVQEDIRAFLWGHRAMKGVGVMSHAGRNSKGNILGDSIRDTQAAVLLLHLLHIFLLGKMVSS